MPDDLMPMSPSSLWRTALRAWLLLCAAAVFAHAGPTVPDQSSETGAAAAGPAAFSPDRAAHDPERGEGEQPTAGEEKSVDRQASSSAGESTPAPAAGEASPDPEQILETQSDESRPAEGRPAEVPPERPMPPSVKPLMVRPLTDTEPGRNDSNPVWSPDGTLLAFERSAGDEKGILIVRAADGQIARQITLRPPEEEGGSDFFFPGLVQEASYNAGLSWAPDSDRFVFMSNAGGGNYDLYLGSVTRPETVRLTDHPGKDGLAHWSPVGDRIVFTSGRTGSGDLFLMNLATRALVQLTEGEHPFLYPQWSPDGSRIAMIYGSSENHDIVLRDNRSVRDKALQALTGWPCDDLRPIWSPDGKRIAFYSNYNEKGDPKSWSLLVVPADGSASGEGPAAKVVATDVIPDVERGPSWLPDSRRIVYVKNLGEGYNPIFIVDAAQGTSRHLDTGTKMNHDVTCSAAGTIAFRAQVEQWDHIFIARIDAEEQR